MPKLNNTNQSNYQLSTFEMGKLYPTYVKEILPNDRVKKSSQIFLRTLPLVTPVMHNVEIHQRDFFVPTRLLDENFEDFITGGEDGNDTTTLPTISTGTYTEGKLYDYIGVPAVDNLSFLAYPIRAINFCYDEYFKDQDLVTTDYSPGSANQDQVDVHKITWKKDYFTTARGTTQRGDAVAVPIGDRADVLGLGQSTADVFTGTTDQTKMDGTGGTTTHTANDVSNGNLRAHGGSFDIYADLSNATGVEINDLREAFALQRFKEARMQYGSKYIDYLRYLGSTPSDARLQRPEYLGGGKGYFNFDAVYQNAPDSGTSTVVGEMAGRGMATLRTNPYVRSFEEHGYLISFLYIRPQTIYTNGLHRYLSRQVKEDYYQKELEAIGSQPILKSEVYAQGTAGGTADSETFGYAPKQYSDYLSTPSMVTDQFRSTLDSWHLARQFSSLPGLNQTFIECTPRESDIFAQSTTNNIVGVINNNCVIKRMVKHNVTNKIL
jgi:hypothetical protein